MTAINNITNESSKLYTKYTRKMQPVYNFLDGSKWKPFKSAPISYFGTLSTAASMGYHLTIQYGNMMNQHTCGI
jgi:hypothetical protein